jgi:hypothetical protein
VNAAPDLRRLEELTLNSSAPPAQLLYDGWLLRLAAGKAKRARSVNAVYPSTLPLEEKLAYCEHAYGAAKLPALFRITPFSHPAGLDEALAARGYGRFETTAVEAAAIPPPSGKSVAQPMPLDQWVDAIGEMRGSPPAHRTGHFARLSLMPLAMRPVAIEAHGRVVATGLVVVEQGDAGLFDIVTREEERRRGHARAIVAALLAIAWDMGARHAYLQVAAQNEAARPRPAG